MDRRNFIKFFGLSPFALFMSGKEVEANQVSKESITEDDILVIECERKLSHEQVKQIRNSVEKNLTLKNKVIVMEGGLKLSVLKK